MRISNGLVVLLAALSPVLMTGGCPGERSARAGEMRGTAYPDPLTKPGFTLNTTAGDPFDFQEATGGYVALLFFGYTHCPDVCPIHMANIAAVLKTLPLSVSSSIKVVMVTTDPDRDTPERLRAWLDAFDPRFIGLRGTLEQVNEIQVTLGLPPAVLYGEGEDYEVGHSARVIAFTRDDRAHFSYPFGTRQVDWAHDLPLLVSGRWNSQ